MKLYLSVVLYKPRWDELRHSIVCMNSCADEYAGVAFLLSGDDSEATTLRNILSKDGPRLSAVVHHRYDNLGFAGGQNFLLDKLFSSDADYVLIYNPDLECSAGALTNFVSDVQSYELDYPSHLYLFGPTLKSVQRGDAEDSTVDSAGIHWTKTARHFDIDQGSPWRTYEKYRVVSGLTGACLLMPRISHERLKGELGYVFDPAFVAFREDAELGVTASRLGIASVCVMQEGFVHYRGNPGTARSSSLVNMLGVQNRLLIRWRLGRARPGNAPLAAFRDIMVLIAAYTVERTSIPGVRSAYAIRRYERYVNRLVFQRSQVLGNLHGYFGAIPGTSSEERRED